MDVSLYELVDVSMSIARYYSTISHDRQDQTHDQSVPYKCSPRPGLIPTLETGHRLIPVIERPVPMRCVGRWDKWVRGIEKPAVWLQRDGGAHHGPA